MLKGIAASSGVAIAKVYKLEMPKMEIEKKDADAAVEVERLNKAVAATVKDIEQIKERAAANLSAEELAVFDAHLMVAQDPEFIGAVEGQINSENCNAEFAAESVANMYVSMFESMEDAYMRERAADIKDVTFRLKANLLGVKIPDLTAIDEEVVIVAYDLTPSDTAQLNKKYTKGFATEIGGRTSHSAIMARSLEIPAVVGCSSILETAKDGDAIILDAIEGDVILNPDAETVKTYEAKRVAFEEEKEALKVLLDAESVSTDGHHVELAGNIGTPNDVEGVLNNGGEGIGLYRTEFLYMNSQDFPTEEEQFIAYKMVLEGMKGKRVVVRTLDIGGDKKLPYFEFPEEMNPFLGYRAIRLCLDRTDIFKTQLRALCRASVYGKLCIMFPMIATVQEFKDAKAIFEGVKADLKAEGVDVADNIEVGMMVEIPAAAVLADQFAKVADFFSIGTNDLIQYSMAADRMSEKVSYLYQPYNPSILRLIKMTIDGAHKEGKWAGMCGEMAGEPDAVAILLGLGLDEFSMSATSILRARKVVTSLSKKEMEDVASKCLEMDSAEDVQAYVKSVINK
ncbi:phosphotransferase system enzyme I (PtsI) [Breznakia sp. PF5-3]|uniref:phosphoenolpyruvate--protein phosphotransferase n=1 Tax=unclassified Breznakia TaxID=2623764 RepID=UPI0024071DE8|nr:MULTISPECIES: phosphoenolpyruvate--protein phosphotransferase [unclassified Breznakia]MDL2276400.1 phosphoenolpyruvate--protein phosphotransferase [Breznakia sp. OttesenSCG-928-G09]MDF9823786.1 phosphotransferase system enzyme I (PtsI) [Breznakia sp. PM6-1]MDF9834648.1 phosphotransferase system enzyme I (PtsI) [Breznakia sp. PF5-3]MDF9836735.1 phosphotransferase system enzyme I (PtsI) [Breznakia sp. PFB2-8]MDF9858816.1 phosphotransferase system enzyme I (PtsI) [Breznakia sp. PH5-24]